MSGARVFSIGMTNRSATFNLSRNKALVSGVSY